MLYSGSTWQLSTQHILYTLGHLNFMLKVKYFYHSRTNIFTRKFQDYPAAADYFNLLIEGAVAVPVSP